jgi:hypothetical protein
MLSLFGDYLPLVLHDLARTVGLPCRATQVLTARPRAAAARQAGGAEEAPARGGRRHFGRGRPARRGALCRHSMRFWVHSLDVACFVPVRCTLCMTVPVLHARALSLATAPYPLVLLHVPLYCAHPTTQTHHTSCSQRAHIVARHNPGSPWTSLLATRVPTWLLLTLLHPPITSTVHRNVTHASIMFQSCNPESPSSRASRLQCIPQAQLDMSMLPRITPIGSWKAAPRASCDAHHPHSSPLALRD